ncbi:reverse transcriptase domain-containing protein [Tanacetum coccineum]
MEKTIKRYGVNHRFSTSYHPQTSGQVENINRALKRILEKTVKDNPAIWSRKLDDALWDFWTSYNTPTVRAPYKLVYSKNCHMLFEIEHRAYWALKNCNPYLIATGEKRMFQLHELDELQQQAYENSRLYKARTQVWHDRKLKMRKEFKHGNKILIPSPVPFEHLLNDFMNPPDVFEMDDLESDNEYVDTPLVSPFIDSDEELDDREVLNELNEYGNALNLYHNIIINCIDKEDLAFPCMIGFRKFAAYFDPIFFQ